MLITMGLIFLAGGAAIVIAALLIQFRAAVQRRAASTALDEEVQDKLKLAKVLDNQLAADILAGADLDSSIDEFGKERMALHALRSDRGWLWGANDLEKWSKTQLAIRVAAINHQSRLVTISVIVLIAVAAIAADASIYHFLSAPAPLLSPYPPAKPITVPQAVPGSAPAVVDPASATMP